MAINSSFPKVAEQIINYNNNVVDLLSKINKLVTSTDPSLTINITDSTGVSKQFTLPSFGFLQSEITRLNNNLNSIYSINEAGALIQPSNGTKFKRVVTIDLNREPNDVSTLPIQTTFKTAKNWFFDGLMNPQIFVELDLSGQIEDNVRKIQCRRYIPKFASNADGSLTPLGQSALNSFNTLFRNINTVSLEDYENWYVKTPGLVSPNDPNYDEQMFDLEPNRLQFDGLFSVLKVEEDTLNRKLFYHLDKLTYVRNIIQNGVATQEARQLKVEDELIINTPVTSTRYRIIEISTASSNPKVRVERIEGNEPIPVGVNTLKIYSPVLYNKSVRISVGYNERNVVFIKPLNMENYILSKNWSKGVGYWTNDLRNVDSGVSLEQYYIDEVYDYGSVINDLVAKKTSTKFAATPNMPVLSADNFKVVQINKHLTDTPDSNLLKNKHNQQNNLKSEIQQLQDAIEEKNKQLRIIRFSSDAARSQFQNDIDNLNKQKESKSKLLSSVTQEIIDLSKSPVSKVDPKFSVRGFWPIPEAVSVSGTKPQEVVQFRIQYRYLSKDGKESPIETFKLVDTATQMSKTAAYSNWNEILTDARKRVYNASTGDYTWEVQDVSNAETMNINQLDIPIQYGEKIEIRIKSISEIGWPDSIVESDWSSLIQVSFPDDLNNVLNENNFIITEANKEDLKVKVQSELTAKGLDSHLSEQVTINNTTYYHNSESILSGFRDQNGVAIDLYQYLQRMENRIKSLEDIIKKVKGELEIIVFRNSDKFVVANGSELVFNIECEDYLDLFTSPGIPSGRVYANNIYVIKDFLVKVKNKSVESPLGLLSSRIYNSSSNSEVLDPDTPQVFWVDNQNELITSDVTGSTKTQLDYQFIWSVNSDGVNQTTKTKLSENIGNSFVSAGSNSITGPLSSEEFNLGYYDPTILTFVGNNKSLLDPSKWIDTTPSVSSTTKLLSSIHPQVQNLNLIQETNSSKVRTINGGENNDINIPINIYFKMNALDPQLDGANYKYVNLNNIKNTVKHVKKVKFLLENEVDNRPFIFTIKFIINRSSAVVRKTLQTTASQVTS